MKHDAPEKIDSPEKLIILTTYPTCLHLEGWNITVEFFIFKRRVFVCSDCGEVLKTREK